MRSFQPHPHVIFSMLTCTRENVCLTIIDGTPNIWVPMESLRKVGKTEKCGAPLVAME